MREDARLELSTAGLKFDKNMIRNLLSEDIMKESVIYQDILQKGEEKGKKEGREEGEKNEAFRFLSRQLNKYISASTLVSEACGR